MKRARVLLFHHVVGQPQGPWDITPAQLRYCVTVLREDGARFGTLDDLAAGEEGVVLTFDDAYLSTYEHAFPILSDLNLVATLFVPVAYVGGTNAWDRLLDLGVSRVERLMSWAQICELQRAGWSIQSHGCTHLPMSILLPGHIEDDLRRSREEIEQRTGQGVGAFAYPFGLLPAVEWRSRADDALSACGYRLALLASGGDSVVPLPEPYRVPRIIVPGPDEDLLEESPSGRIAGTEP